MKYFKFSFLFMFFISLVLCAQNQSVTQIQNVGGSVSLRITGEFQNQEKFSGVPVELLDELTKVKFLKNLLLNSSESKQNLTATFVFTNYESFKQWYSSAETKKMFKNLSEFFHGGIKKQFSFTRR